MEIQHFELAGSPVNYINYCIDPRFRVMSWMNERTPDGWRPVMDDSPIHDRLPFKWDDVYVEVYKQNFQPIRFLTNCSALTRFIRESADETDRLVAESIIEELFTLAEKYIMVDDGCAYVLNRFGFIQQGVDIPPDWVGALSNAFVILGLCLLCKTKFRQKSKQLLHLLCNGYLRPFRHSHSVPSRWITYVDEDGFIWFEEYPEPNGKLNLVLNGHIFSIHALHEASKLITVQDLPFLVKAGITTIRYKAPLFRRKGKTNIYSLLGTRKGDYLPPRTVRQQCELYALTGDEFFKNMASTFYNDAKLVYDFKDEPVFRHCIDRYLWNEELRVS